MFSLILSIILLTATVVFSILNERSELRNELHKHYDSQGNYAVVLHNVSSEVRDKIYDLFEKSEIGIISAIGKTTINETCFTVGSFENNNSVRDYCIPFVNGNLPHVGEVAVPEFLLEQMYSDIKVGDTVEFVMTDLNGNDINMSFILSGIIRDGLDRWDLGYRIDSSGVVEMNDQIQFPSPTIYINKTDAENYIKYYNYLISPDERTLFYDSSCPLDNKLSSIYPMVNGVSTGGRYSNLVIMSKNNGNKQEDFKVEQTDNIRIIHIITTFMMIIAAIAMFSGVATIMPKRIESLRLLRTIGMSKKRLLILFITEFIMFWIIGNIIGLALGCGVHELVCIIREHIGISAFKGYKTEFIIEEMTEDPFIKPLIISVTVAAAAIILPVIKIVRMAFNKNDTIRKSRKKVRTLDKAFSKITNTGILMYLSAFSIILVIIVSSLGYCYYTNYGKGKSFLSYSIPDSTENIYKVQNIDLRKNSIDCALLSNIPVGNKISLFNKEYGISSEKISKLNEKADVYAWSEYPACTVVYDKNAEHPMLLNPDPIITEDWEYYDKYDVYDVNLILLSGKMLSLLGDFSDDDVLMLSKTQRFPINIGENINMFTSLCDENRNTDLSTVKEIVVPVTQTYCTGKIMDSDVDILKNCIALNYRSEFAIAMTAEKAEKLGFYHAEYSSVFINFLLELSDEEIKNEVRNIINRPIHITTISELREKARMHMISANLNAFILSMLLIILCVVSIINHVGMNIQNNLDTFYVMNMLGLPLRRIKYLFLKKLMKNILAASVIGSIAALLGQRFISSKYDEYIDMLEKQQTLLNNGGYPEIIIFIKKSGIDKNNAELLKITDMIDKLHDKYFLAHEISEPNIWIPLLFICSFIIVIASIATIIQLRKLNIQEGDVNDKNQ